MLEIYDHAIALRFYAFKSTLGGAFLSNLRCAGWDLPRNSLRSINGSLDPHKPKSAAAATDELTSCAAQSTIHTGTFTAPLANGENGAGHDAIELSQDMFLSSSAILI
jgi:hypothetical protein